MIKIAFGSDLHCEFDRRNGTHFNSMSMHGDGHPPVGPPLLSVKEKKCHALILAGDIEKALFLPVYLKAVADYLEIPVIAVLGNHEYYGGEYHRVKKVVAAAGNHPLVHLLDDDACTFEFEGTPVRFIGATLWTDYRLNETRIGQDQSTAMREARDFMNDFRAIKKEGALFCPEDALELHESARSFIEQEISKKFDGKTVVVTHHSPSPETEDAYKESKLSASFSSNLHYLMQGENAPDFWVHGHTHEDGDVVVGNTRILSRQRGYPGEKRGFEFGIIEI